MRLKTLFLCAGLIAVTLSSAHAELVDNQKFSLEAAIRQTLLYSPKLKASLEGMSASQGDRLQSGLVPNPEFSVEAENILGSGTAQGFDEAETTFGVAQPIELGGKRAARIKAANEQIGIAELTYRATALDLVRDTATAWAEAVAAYEEVNLAKSQQDLASDVLQSVKKRVSAAAEPAIQQSKSEVALASSRIALQKAQRNLDTAMKNLARMWGEETLAYTLDTEDFFRIEKPVQQEDPSLAGNPDIQLLDAGVNLAGANLNLEKSNAVPDVTVGVGIKDSREADNQSFVAGLSIPFPVFNRNQGAILKAGHEVSKAEHEKMAAYQQINLELVQVQNTLETSWLEVESLKSDILPSAEKAFTQARRGYQAGKFAYLEVLDAQRTLAEVRGQHVAALKEYHTAQAQFDRLTGKNIHLLNVHGEKK